MTEREELQKLSNAFQELRIQHGFIAEEDFLCCTSCGWATIGGYPEENTKNVVFYHNQNVKDWEESGYINLAWRGDVEKAIEVIKKHGLNAYVDKEREKKIYVCTDGFMVFARKSFDQEMKIYGLV